MPVDISLDLSELQPVLDRIESFPTKEYMGGLASVALLQADARFDTKTDPEGQAWKPWSPGYRKQGAPFHSQHTLLHLSGDMRGSLQLQEVASNRAAIVSDGIPYADRQNTDRQFLGFIDDDPELAEYSLGYLSTGRG
jgi:hypothetical protein